MDAEIARLTEAIAMGGALAPLLAALQARQQRREALGFELAAFDALLPPRIDGKAIERRVRGRLTAWRALLTEQVQDGRELLRQEIAGRCVSQRREAATSSRAKRPWAGCLREQLDSQLMWRPHREPKPCARWKSPPRCRPLELARCSKRSFEDGPVV